MESSFQKFVGMITEIVNTEYYSACPHCSSKVSSGNRCVKCDSSRTPIKKMIVSILLDDETGVIKVTFFGTRAEQLLEIQDKQLHDFFQMSPIEFLDSKLYHTKSADLIGKDIMVLGKVTENEFNNLLEINGTSFTYI